MINFLYPSKPLSTGISPFDNQFDKLANLNSNFVMELKIDGWAAEVIKDHQGKYHYYNRHGKPLDKSFLTESIKEFEKLNIPNETILGFEAVGKRSIHIKDKMFFYGVYVYAGKRMNRESYAENKRLLESLIVPSDHLHVVTHYTKEQANENFIDLLKRLIDESDYKDIIEGIVLKDITQPVVTDFYKTRKIPQWCKFKFKN